MEIPTEHSPDRDKRFERAESGVCPLCGVAFNDAREVFYRETNDGTEEMPGIEYDHGINQCVDWADGGLGTSTQDPDR